MCEITICVLAYNAGQYLEETLNSLEKQNGDFKYLLVVDGSTDNTVDICNAFVNQSSNEVVVHIFNENHGTAFCRNWAVYNAETKYMMFFDSDDIAKPRLIEKLYQRITEEIDCIAVSCYAQYIDEKGQKLPGGMFFKMPDKNAFFERASKGKFIFMLPATLFNRDYGMKSKGYRLDGFPKDKIRYEDLSEDLDFWSRLSDFYIDRKSMITIPETLYYYRKRTGSLSSSKKQQFAMSLKMKFIKINLKKRRAGENEISFINFLEQRTKLEKVREHINFYSEYYYRVAAFAFAEKKYLKAIVFLPLSIILNPNYLYQKIQANIGNM